MAYFIAKQNVNAFSNDQIKFPTLPYRLQVNDNLRTKHCVNGPI